MLHDADVRIALLAEERRAALDALPGGDPVHAGFAAMLDAERAARQSAFEDFIKGWASIEATGMRESLRALANGAARGGDEDAIVTNLNRAEYEPVSDLARRVRRAVADLAEQETAFLRDLVRTPSQTGDEAAVQRVVADAYRGHRLETEVREPVVADLADWAEHVTPVANYEGRPNVVGVRRGSGGGRSLILNAHIDTVEVGDRAQWTHDPLGGEIDGGRLWGRGSCDMKGGLTSNLFALLALERAGYRPKGDVILESVISEEDGGAGALAAVLNGTRADAAIISEPTRRAIVPAQGGSLMFRSRKSLRRRTSRVPPPAPAHKSSWPSQGEPGWLFAW